MRFHSKQSTNNNIYYETAVMSSCLFRNPIMIGQTWFVDFSEVPTSYTQQGSQYLVEDYIWPGSASRCISEMSFSIGIRVVYDVTKVQMIYRLIVVQFEIYSIACMHDVTAKFLDSLSLIFRV